MDPKSDPGGLAGSGAFLDAALRAIVSAGHDWARLCTRTSLRASLQRLLDEAAVSLPATIRQQVERAVAGPDDDGAPVSDWVALLLDCARIVEEDVAARTGRLKESINRSGALLGPGALRKALGALTDETLQGEDVGSLLDRRRALSLAEADIARLEWETGRRWEGARNEVAAKVGGAAAEAAEAGLRNGDLLPVAEALDALASLQDRGASDQDPLREQRSSLEEALKASRDLLSQEEIDWIRTALSECPTRGVVRARPIRDAWSEALEAIQGLLSDLVPARSAALEQLEQRFGQESAGLAATGYRRLLLLIEATHQRQAAQEGRLEAAHQQCLDAEWELSRSVWEDGPLASASALLNARRAFLDCHRGKELVEDAAVGEIARSATLAAARIRLEASWRRRWLLRHGMAGPEERQREMQRLVGKLPVDAQALGGGDLESRCREAEAALRAALARRCAELESASGTDPVLIDLARQGLRAGETASVDRALREARR